MTLPKRPVKTAIRTTFRSSKAAGKTNQASRVDALKAGSTAATARSAALKAMPKQGVKRVAREAKLTSRASKLTARAATVAARPPRPAGSPAAGRGIGRLAKGLTRLAGNAAAGNSSALEQIRNRVAAAASGSGRTRPPRQGNGKGGGTAPPPSGGGSGGIPYTPGVSDSKLQDDLHSSQMFPSSNPTPKPPDRTDTTQSATIGPPLGSKVSVTVGAAPKPVVSHAPMQPIPKPPVKKPAPIANNAYGAGRQRPK